MTTASESLEPAGYIDAVLSAYVDMPETPIKPSAGDRKTAKGLLARGVPLHTIRTALTLGSLRRLGRPSDYPRLQPVRSLAYFLPVIDELLETPVPENYGGYLNDKLRQVRAGTLKRSAPPTGGRPKNYVSS